MRMFKYLTIAALLFVCSALFITGEGRAENIVVGPQFDVFIGPNSQLVPFVAFDTYNRRFLVVWNENYTNSPTEVDIFGQLLNADGTPYGGKIAIAVVSGSTQGPSRITFDSVNKRFLVIFMDNRNSGQYQAYGQFINADGTLFGGNFSVTPSLPQGHSVYPVGVAYDSTLNRFFVLILKNTGTNKADLFGQFIGTTGSLIGNLFQITSSPANSPVLSSSMGYDSNHGRFLIVYGRATINRIEGIILNGDGTTFLGNFLISPAPGGIDSYPVPFDPVDNKFLVLWNTADYYVHGRMITADGMVLCNELLIPFNPSYDPGTGVAIFDASRNKFIVVAQSVDPAISGQVVTPDGLLEGSYFPIVPRGNSTPLRPFFAFGASDTGSLVVWPDNQTAADYDLYGRFLMPGGINYALATIEHYYAYGTEDDFISNDSVFMDERWGWSTANATDIGAQVTDARFTSNCPFSLLWEGQAPSSQVPPLYTWNYGTDVPENYVYGVGGKLAAQSQKTPGITAERDVVPERLDDQQTTQTITVDVAFNTLPPEGATVYIGNVNDVFNTGVITSEVLNQNNLPKWIEKIEYGRAVWSIASADIQLNTTYTFAAQIKAVKSPSVTGDPLWKPSVEIEMFDYATAPAPAAGTSYILQHPGGVKVTFGAANSITWLPYLVSNGIQASMAAVYTDLPDVPNAPSGLTATNITSTGATLNWTDNSDNEDGFIIKRTDGNGNVVTFTVGPNVTTFTDDTGAPGTTYTYVVQATNAGGNSGDSNPVTITTTTGKPSAPTQLLITNVTSNSVALQWTDNSNNETGFEIRRTNGGTVVFTVGANTTTYTDNTAQPNTTYSYQVFAKNGSVYSDGSNIVPIITPPTKPAAPTNLQVQGSTPTSVTLKWTDNSNNETGFVITRLNGGSATFQFGPNVTTFTDTTVTSGTTYIYFVVARNTGGDSAPSNNVNVTVPLPNVAPVLAPIGNKSVNEGVTLQFTISATDANGGALTYSASNLPAGAVFNAQTRIFTWQPTYQQSGVYNNVHFQVTDGTFIDSEDITITVSNVNAPPQFDPDMKSEYTIKRLHLLYFRVHAHDPEGGSVHYSIRNKPWNAIFWNGYAYSYKHHRLVWAGHYWWVPNLWQGGDFTITIIAKDRAGNEAAKNITIHVKNDPPTLKHIGNKSITATASHCTGILHFWLKATDTEAIDYSGLRYHAQGLPAGASLNPYNGYFRWDPTLAQRGTYTVKFYVTDWPGLRDEETITITVN